MIHGHFRSLPRCSCVLLAALCLPVAAGAGQAGTLAGLVVDQTGVGLPGARIIVRGGETRSGDTNATGGFEFQGLPPGDYDVVVERSGFQTARRTIRLAAGDRTVVSLTMNIAIVEQAIVTAARVGKNDVQAIPMAISAISNEDLGRLGTSTVDQAAALAPSVMFTQNASAGQLSIRGVGTNVVYAGADPSSAMYLDGVYLARPAMAFVELLDLDRIEVLRGPQGTLYGRNAVGGALNLVSKAPANDLEASARVTGGDFGALRAEARASGPIKPDHVMGSLAFTRGIRDGYVRDLEHPDHPLGGDDLTAARGQVRVVFDPRTNLLVSSDVTHQEAPLLAFNKVLAVKPGFQIDNPADPLEVRTSVAGWNHTLQYGAAARLTRALTPATTLDSLTAYRKLDYEFVTDADITELDLLTFHQHEQQHQLSEEIVVSHEQPRLTWIGGLFFFAETDRQSLLGDQPPSRAQVRLLPRVDANSRAAFAQASVGLTSQLSATAGVRYTHERKEIDNAGGRYSLNDPAVAIPGSVYDYADSIAHSAWTPKFGLDLKLPNRALAYVSAARGFKSGGFNPSSTAPGRGYAPEWAWSYEGGVKGALLNGRSRFALSAFAMDYTNLQVQTPLAPGIYDIRNAASATIRGLEVENTTRLAGAIEAGGHVTWLDATYDQYVAVDLGGATSDVAGNRLNNAPEWAGRLWVAWTGSIGNAQRLTLIGDATAESTVYYTPFNDGIQRQRSYGLLGVRAEYGPRNRRWSINAYVRNVTDTNYIMATFGNSPAAFGGRPGAPRQVAIEFAARR